MNTELLRAVAGKILSDPEGWNQAFWARIKDDSDDLIGVEAEIFDRGKGEGEFSAWAVPACGTAKCFAGWALHLEDPTMKMLMGAGGLALLTTGQVVDIDDHARELLELSHDEARILFNGSNTLGDIIYLLTSWGVFGHRNKTEHY